MLGMIDNMTQEEKKSCLKKIEKGVEDCAVDGDAMLDAADKVYINTLIGIQFNRNDMCENIGIKPIALTTDEFIAIGIHEKEEDRRVELSKIIAIKFKNISEDDVIDKKKFNKFIGRKTKMAEKQETLITKEDDEKNNIRGGVAVDRLKSILERVERLEHEKKGIADDIKDIFAEAKSAGFDIKALKAVLKIRKMDPSDREEQEHWIETYKHALNL